MISRTRGLIPHYMRETKLKNTLMFKFLFSLASGVICAIVVALFGVIIVATCLFVRPSLKGVGWVELGAFAVGFLFIFFWLLEISHYTEHDHDRVKPELPAEAGKKQR